MTDIFDMEDEVSTLTSQLHTKIVISPAGALLPHHLLHKN